MKTAQLFYEIKDLYNAFIKKNAKLHHDLAWMALQQTSLSQWYDLILIKFSGQNSGILPNTGLWPKSADSGFWSIIGHLSSM